MDDFENDLPAIEHLRKGASISRRQQAIADQRSKKNKRSRGAKSERTEQFNVRMTKALKEETAARCEEHGWNPAEYTERAFKFFNAHLDKMKGGKNA